MGEALNKNESTPEISSLLNTLIHEISLLRIETKINQQKVSKEIQNLQTQVNDLHHSAGLASFPRFNSLPKELRLKIWGFAALTPRTIGMQLYKCVSPSSEPHDLDGDDLDKDPTPDMVLVPTGPPSALFLVNDEARKVAMKHSTIFEPRVKGVPVLRWNSNVNTLWVVNLPEWLTEFGKAELVPLLRQGQCRGCNCPHSLAMPWKAWERTLKHVMRRGNHGQWGFMELIAVFKILPRLEEIILVVGECGAISRCTDIKWKRPSNIPACEEFETLVRRYRAGQERGGSMLRLEVLERALGERFIEMKRDITMLANEDQSIEGAADCEAILRGWTPPKYKIRTAVSGREAKHV
jgi:hypothetical protein